MNLRMKAVSAVCGLLSVLCASVAFAQPPKGCEKVYTSCINLYKSPILCCLMLSPECLELPACGGKTELSTDTGASGAAALSTPDTISFTPICPPDAEDCVESPICAGPKPTLYTATLEELDGTCGPMEPTEISFLEGLESALPDNCEKELPWWSDECVAHVGHTCYREDGTIAVVTGEDVDWTHTDSPSSELQINLYTQDGEVLCSGLYRINLTPSPIN